MFTFIFKKTTVLKDVKEERYEYCGAGQIRSYLKKSYYPATEYRILSLFTITV